MREEAIQKHLDGQNGSEHLLLLKQHPQYSLEKSCLTETLARITCRSIRLPFQSREHPTEREKNHHASEEKFR